MNRRSAILAVFSSFISILFTAPKAFDMNENTQAKFALKFFSQTVSDLPLENILVSPLSVYLALSLVYNGSARSTKKQISQVLESQNLDLLVFNQDNLNLQNLLKNSQHKLTLSIANSLWIKSGFKIYQKFVNTLQKFYSAEVTDLDFNNPQSATQINQWVQKNTHNKINKIIDKISTDQVLFLINAIYFKGLWSIPFDEKLTKVQPFFKLDGSTQEVSLMSISGKYPYFENELFQAVSLPYQDDNLSLDIFLPRKSTDLRSLLSQFKLENWQLWVSEFRKNKGNIQIPRFKIEYTITLNKILEKLGMDLAFDPGKADFSALTNMPISITEVLHKTYIEVNEEGSEAAAVTSVMVGATAIPFPSEPFEFRADRPFVFSLRDKKTSSLLFMGLLVSPD